MKQKGQKMYLPGILLYCAMVSTFCCEEFSYEITKTWDNKSINHPPIFINLTSQDEYIVMKIDAPFFNDPHAPDGVSGKPFNKLWDYEVVEAFFLGQEEKYLEVEFSPHGQHLLLLLSGRKNAIKMCLPVEYAAFIKGDTWSGLAKIPKSYFPPKVNSFNAYAIHGSGENRTYEALYPVPSNHFDHPDFHRLEYFRYVDFTKLLPWNHPLSPFWEDALTSSSKGDELVCS